MSYWDYKFIPKDKIGSEKLVVVYIVHTVYGTSVFSNLVLKNPPTESAEKFHITKKH